MAHLRLTALGAVFFGLLCVPAQASSISCSDPGTGNSSANATFVNANSCVDFSATVQGANNWYYGYYTAESSPGVVNAYANNNPPILDPNSFTQMTPTPLLGANGQILPGQYLGVWSQNFFQYFTSLSAFGGHSNGTYTDSHIIDTLPGDPYVISPGPNSYCIDTNTIYYNCNPNGGYYPGNPTGTSSGNFWATRRYVVPSGFSGNVTIDLSSERQSDIPNSQAYTDYILQDSGGVVTDLGSIYVPGDAPTTQVFSTTAIADVNPGDFLDFVIVPQYEVFQMPNGQPLPPGYADFASGQLQLDTISSGGGQIIVGVPEPATMGLFAVALVLFGFGRRRLQLR
jgi:hypothetical protein